MNWLERWATGWLIKKILVVDILGILVLYFVEGTDKSRTLFITVLVAGNILAAITVYLMIKWARRFWKKRGIHYKNERQKRNEI